MVIFCNGVKVGSKWGHDPRVIRPKWAGSCPGFIGIYTYDPSDPTPLAND